MAELRSGRRTDTAADTTAAGAGRGAVVRRWREWLGAGALLTAVVVFVLFTVVALAVVVPGYSWSHSMISDLGAATCVERSGHRMCSPRAAWFDMGLAVSGLCAVAGALCLAPRWGRSLSAAVVSLGVGLLLLGTVPSDAGHSVHMAGAVLALPVTAAGLLVSGLRDRRTEGPVATSRAVFGGVALTLCLDHLAGDAAAPIPRGVAELISIAAILTAVLSEAYRACPVSRGLTPRGAGTAATRRATRRSGPSTAPGEIPPP